MSRSPGIGEGSNGLHPLPKIQIGESSRESLFNDSPSPRAGSILGDDFLDANAPVDLDDFQGPENTFSFKGRAKQPSTYTNIFGLRNNGKQIDVSENTLSENDFSTYSRPNSRMGRAASGQPRKDSYADWVIAGPGRRVAYDDFTAIDWIHEYTIERLRKRALDTDTSLLAPLWSLFDASQVWVVLVFTGIATGLIAAGIDIASIWLADLKNGFCKPTFYLSKGFCCWGYSFSEQCKDWIQWPEAMNVSNKGGAYVLKFLLFVLYSILFATTASFLTLRYAPYARHSGIPEIKTVLGGFVIRRFMGTWTLVIKSLGLCLSVASSLWLGKEGPLVHVACCCANMLMKPFSSLAQNEARKREVLSAAAAAGISVAFGSPIGGVLFSLEQVSYYFPEKTMWQSFVCAMVAAVTLKAMNPFRTGKLVLYQVTYTRTWHDFEIIPFIVIGLLGGLYGAFMIKFNLKIAGWRKDTIVRFYPITEVAVVALVSALISFPNIFMRIQATELVSFLYQECHDNVEDFLGICQVGKTAGPVVLLLFAALLGALLASFTFGLILPAGIILPSMAVGALYGRAVGMLVQVWHRNHPTNWMLASCEPDVPCITPGVYAIIGAASTLAGVTRMTVSIVVIMFELTGALTYVLPIMIAVMISKWVGDFFDKRGIYERWIDFKEYPYLENRDDPVPDVQLSQVMTRLEDLTAITATGHTIKSLDELLHVQTYKGFPVVTDTREAVLLGYISRSELRFALDQARHVRKLPSNTDCYFINPQFHNTLATEFVDLRPWMDQTPITLPAKTNLLLVSSLFQKLGLRYILFAYHGQLQGLLTKKDVWFILNSARDNVNVRATGMNGGVAGQESTGNLRDTFEREVLLDVDEDDDESTGGIEEPHPGTRIRH